MFECRLNQFLVEILQQYNASLGLNNPPPTAQLLNAMASFVKQNTVKNIELFFDGNSNSLTAKATYNDNRFAETSVDLGSLKYELDVYDLAEKLQGSESIVVDIDESNSKIEFHLDGEILSKIDRALLVPVQRPYRAELVGVNASGEQVSIGVGSPLYIDEEDNNLYTEPTLFKHTAYFSECLISPDDYLAEVSVVFLSASPLAILPRNAIDAMNMLIELPKIKWYEDYYSTVFCPYAIASENSIFVYFFDTAGHQQRLEFFDNTEMYSEIVESF